MTAFEQEAVRVLSLCSFLPSSFDKRLVRRWAESLETQPRRPMTEKGKAYLWRLVWKYRRQIGNIGNKGLVKKAMTIKNSYRAVIKGRLRIIRDVRQNDAEGFFAYYRGCSIAISEYGYTRPGERKRWSFDVRGNDGCYIVNTWEYDDEFTIEQLVVKALESILG
jgi:hypothetical protein